MLPTPIGRPDPTHILSRFIGPAGAYVPIWAADDVRAVLASQSS